MTVALILVMLGMSVQSTKAELFPTYVSGITIQNTSASSAHVTVDYYDQTGAVVDTTTDTIDAYGVKDYATVPVDSGFQGSVVISSDQPIGAVSTLRGDNKGRGAYDAFDSGASPVVLPFLMKDWGSSLWSTWFSVQNVGTANADITVDYAACSGETVGANDVAPGAMVTFNQKTETCWTTAKVMTSAVVTGTQDLVVVVSQESTVVNSSLVSPGFGTGDPFPVIPLMNSNNPNTTGWRTAIGVFNMGSSSTNVTMTYIRTDGTSCTETTAVAAQTSATFAGNHFITGEPAGWTTTCALGSRIVGSAYVSANSANQDLVATVNQDRGAMSSAYGAMAKSAGTPKVVFPQIQDRNGSSSQWASSIMVFNAGAAATFVKCSFASSSYAPTSGSLAINRAWENLQRGNIAASYVGSGQCTAYTDATYATVDSAAKLVAVVNVRGTGVGLYDLMMSYEAINVTP
jgi:hypothetical protein